MNLKLIDSVITLSAFVGVVALVWSADFALAEAADSTLAATPSTGSRRGDLNPDTIIYTKSQADQVFMKKGEAVAPPAYVVVTNTATIKCVYGTNIVPVPNGATLTADLSGWAEGQTVFTKIVPAGTYSVATTITLTGYGTWPTAPFDCVAWKSGEKVYITVIREE